MVLNKEYIYIAIILVLSLGIVIVTGVLVITNLKIELDECMCGLGSIEDEYQFKYDGMNCIDQFGNNSFTPIKDKNECAIDGLA